MRHYFNTELAKIVGLHAAVIYHHFCFWCKQNEREGVNEKDGLYWTFHSAPELMKFFPYLTKRQILYAIKKLEEKGLIRIGCYNKLGMDRTYWYAVLDYQYFYQDTNLSHDETILLHGETNMSHGETNMSLPCDKNVSPIPNRTPYRTQKIEHKEVSKKDSESFDSILDSYELIILHPDLKEIFLEFIKMRKAKKKPLTNKALKLGVNKAIKLGNSDPDIVKRIVEETIEHCWDSFYPLKEEKKATAKKSDNPFEDMMREEGYL